MTDRVKNIILEALRDDTLNNPEFSVQEFIDDGVFDVENPSHRATFSAVLAEKIYHLLNDNFEIDWGAFKDVMDDTIDQEASVRKIPRSDSDRLPDEDEGATR